jgi:hypothetical protein
MPRGRDSIPSPFASERWESSKSAIRNDRLTFETGRAGEFGIGPLPARRRSSRLEERWVTVDPELPFEIGPTNGR